MKFSFRFLLSTALTGSFIFSSCSKKLEEAYRNPNATVRVPVETLLPSIIGNFQGSSSAAGSAYGLAGDALLIGRYIQYWGTLTTTFSPVSYSAANQSNYDAMGGTIAASDNLGSVWAAHYFGMGQNVNRMIDWATEEEKWDYVGAGWAVRAWSMLEATNEYGEIILRQAFNTNLQTFTYEDQPEVYDSVRVICHRAISFLERTGGNANQANFLKGDAFFNGGDVNKWKKFVYGILARSYQNISNKSTYSADSAIKYADLAMNVNDDNATVEFANTGITGTSNYYGPLRGNVGSIRQGAYIANIMTGLNTGAFTGVQDPRAWYILRENPNGAFKGILPNKGTSGLGVADQPQSFWGARYDSTVAPATMKGRYLFRNDAPFPIMTASEMQFIKAEAAYLKGDKTTALAAYTLGISLNTDMLTTIYNVNIPVGKEITPAIKSAFLTNPAVVPATPGALNLTQIMLQKYIALYGWGVQETWTDMRRYNYNQFTNDGKLVYADFAPPSGTDLYLNNNNQLVYRARPRYNSEYLYNIPELTRIGAIQLDYHTKKPWFAIK